MRAARRDYRPRLPDKLFCIRNARTVQNSVETVSSVLIYDAVLGSARLARCRRSTTYSPKRRRRVLHHRRRPGDGRVDAGCPRGRGLRGALCPDWDTRSGALPPVGPRCGRGEPVAARRGRRRAGPAAQGSRPLAGDHRARRSRAAASRSVEATQAGAFYFLQKPVTRDGLVGVLQNAFERMRERAEHQQLKDQVRGQYSFCQRGRARARR